MYSLPSMGVASNTPKMSLLKSISGKKEGVRRIPPAREPQAGYRDQVAEKLRSHPSFKDCNGQQIAELVNRTTKAEELLSYFDLTQDPDEDGPSPPGAKLNPEVKALEVQLVLKHLSCGAEKPDDIERMLLQEYGPLQAYLVVGDVVLEWDWNSLVIPHGKPIRDVTTPSVVKADVRVAELPSVKVDLLKTKVLDLVARYNRIYYYHVIRRNAHGFVCNVLEAMNHREMPQQMHSKLNEYLDALEKNASKSLAKQFRSHDELDRYVLQQGNLDDTDIEFLIVQYFMVHMVDRMQHNDPWKWKCTMPDCRMKTLEAFIDHKKLLLQKFTTVKYNFYESTAV